MAPWSEQPRPQGLLLDDFQNGGSLPPPYWKARRPWERSWWLERPTGIWKFMGSTPVGGLENSFSEHFDLRTLLYHLHFIQVLNHLSLIFFLFFFCSLPALYTSATTLNLNLIMVFFLSLYIFLSLSMRRAKNDLDANLAVAHTWSEFNSMLDKQRVCS